ncbi:uncharacterized protein LOC113387751 [Ctenocephalides felis]|uniref:uncharacterized protein LOC113387750 n=1 Tax=Ctenocephalides felis TaxID=7515 RepID=UPI000E6E19DC|nr:uncharacterized protein LOC113387750 [Ctenocephalides felis]XP_026480912.1 uncharacterized protein LOC113387751 [Ctenocephalides felis]
MFLKAVLVLSLLAVMTNCQNEANNRTLIDRGFMFRQGEELNGYCQKTTDCRDFAYDCILDQCECRMRYMIEPKEGKTCVGAVTQQCYYDIHCIENAYCHDQRECRCKPEFPVVEEDGFKCSGAAMMGASGVIISFLMTAYKLL